jgi:hypothetical protein
MDGGDSSASEREEEQEENIEGSPQKARAQSKDGKKRPKKEKPVLTTHTDIYEVVQISGFKLPYNIELSITSPSEWLPAMNKIANGLLNTKTTHIAISAKELLEDSEGYSPYLVLLNKASIEAGAESEAAVYAFQTLPPARSNAKKDGIGAAAVFSPLTFFSLLRTRDQTSEKPRSMGDRRGE